MAEIRQSGRVPPPLARRAHLAALSLALLGSCLGVFALRVGKLTGAEAAMVAVSSLCCCGVLIALLYQRYAEEKRIKALRVSAQVLDTIPECFVALDAATRLTYLNDAACAAFGVERQAALAVELFKIGTGFFSESMMQGLRDALTRNEATLFEAQNEARGQWYDIRCSPGPDGMSIQWRNTTTKVLTRRSLEEAHVILSERAELLDKAQDAIFVLGMDFLFTYWNQGAERLYGWQAADVIGKSLDDIFGYTQGEFRTRIEAIFTAGDWCGEVRQKHKDGRPLAIETRITLVKDDKGNGRAMLAINTDISARKANEAKIDLLAFYDLQTALPNRQLLRLRLSEALEAAAERNEYGAMLYIDLDDFKTFNETMGHDAGDALLGQVARRLANAVDPGHTVARLGGDEFAVMLEGLGDDPGKAAATAKAVGERILSLFLKPFAVGSYESDMQASIGATLFRGASATFDDLMKQGDLAMYAAKAAGRNGMCFFNPAMQAAVDARVSLRADLRRALSNGEFELRYQPQVDDAGTVTGAEGLLRWYHPVRGNVPPAEFIPLAEEAGLIVELGCWVLETACAQIATWSKRPATEQLTVSVNVSLRQFVDPHFVQQVQEALRRSGANPQRLRLEITESSVMQKVEEIIFKMTKIRAFGVSFSMDDFGTGYSSLSHLRHLPLQQLKIDRSFVRNVLSDAKDASIIRMIILLGRSLNLTVIAEGVETAAQRDFLMQEGCRFYQGYLYGPAMVNQEFEAFAAGANKVPEMPVGSVLAA